MSIRHHNVDGSEAETELLCSTDDVARYIRPRSPIESPDQIFTDTFDADTTPTADDVTRHIESASARFERITQQGWRSNRVVDETHDHFGLYYWLSGHPINLMKREIRPLDPDKGDKLEEWTGNVWRDWLSEGSYESGRDADYWLDAPVGLLWVYERAILRPHPKFRLTYRYGYEHVPHDVRDAVAMKAAADMATGDFGGLVTPGNNQGDSADPNASASYWKEEFLDVADSYKRLSWI